MFPTVIELLIMLAGFATGCVVTGAVRSTIAARRRARQG